MVLYVIVFICLIFQAERAVLDTYYVWSVLNLGRKKIKHRQKNSNDFTIYCLIPALKEQDIIISTIKKVYKNIKQKNIKIVIITTAKECSYDSRQCLDHPTTKDVVDNFLKFTKGKYLKNKVMVIHYPKVSGKMAHQINFALKQITKFDPEAFFILYNADSITSRAGFSCFSNFFVSNPNAVIQQPCAFIKDIDMKSKPFVNAVSLFQTLFCIGHETGLILRYNERLKNVHSTFAEFLMSPLAWIVGHGSAMSIKTCLKYGGFPEKYMNEDLTFGYILSSLKQPIYSIPYLEIADVPLSWKVFIKQKTVWFWNFLEYIRCYSHPSLKQVPKARRIALLIIGWSRAVYWFFSAFFFGLPLILGIVFLNFKVFLLGTFGFLCFSILPISFLYLYLPRTLEKQGLKSYAENLRSISFLKTAFWLPLIFLSDSIGPWIATWQWIIWKLANVLPDKPKTD